MIWNNKITAKTYHLKIIRVVINRHTYLRRHVGKAAVRSNAVVLWLLIYCFMYSHCLWGVCVDFQFGMHYFYVLSSFEII